MSKYDREDFEARKAAMLEEIRAVMDDVEELYNQGSERAGEEIEELKASLGGKLDAAKRKLRRFEEETADSLKRNSAYAKEKFRRFEEEAGKQIKHRARQADEAVHEKPYYAMGFAALAGLVVGVLLNRR
ncbi:Bacterial protein of uncharacterised function (DUF883) [Kingella potus]|uniref:Bacterial protein of uncharacterized function (DUF883) n=1 Tax=Kingella potus TaxID=265175 RepID=A0A377QZ85_9NEIS|nr:DUF883 family protein [Kingella potus]UOP00899.1 DUF883 family protein [Kingella potus]STR00553.1 Bacterial protein of uncharacterised function (DUF883) [Kingella potus]